MYELKFYTAVQCIVIKVGVDFVFYIYFPFIYKSIYIYIGLFCFIKIVYIYFIITSCYLLLFIFIIKSLIFIFHMCIYCIFLIICNSLLHHTAKYISLIFVYIKSHFIIYLYYFVIDYYGSLFLNF